MVICLADAFVKSDLPQRSLYHRMLQTVDRFLVCIFQRASVLCIRKTNPVMNLPNYSKNKQLQ